MIRRKLELQQQTLRNLTPSDSRNPAEKQFGTTHTCTNYISCLNC
jgi:hypothetical protein